MKRTSALERLINLRVLKAALMIAGTAIGAGMLGIPLVTSNIGFTAGTLVTFLVWAYMFVTGIFLMEVSISMKEKGGFLSMAGKYLPSYGKEVTAALFLFLYGILLVAYISAGAEIFCMNLSDNLYVRLLFPIILFGILSLGSNKVITIISLLTIPMWIYFLMFYVFGVEFIRPERLLEGVYSKAYLAIPVLFGAFGYHNVIPSISKYLEYNRKNLSFAIFLGSLIPCIVYMLWQALILGIVDTETISYAREKGVPIVTLLGTVTGSGLFQNIGAMFAFFAIMTSALGVGISVIHFIDKKAKNQTTFFVILFPAMIAFVNPGIFLRALSFAGGFGESLLNGIIPIWMYAAYKSSTGKMSKKVSFCTFFLFLIALFVVTIEVYNLL
ncbi:MAG: Tyrosine-specific transport protein [Chlamydiia bacterium]|nr:Tyrosine-specific transport protein [Chlamydiia bacterium]